MKTLHTQNSVLLTLDNILWINIELSEENKYALIAHAVNGTYYLIAEYKEKETAVRKLDDIMCFSVNDKDSTIFLLEDYVDEFYTYNDAFIQSEVEKISFERGTICVRSQDKDILVYLKHTTCIEPLNLSNGSVIAANMNTGEEILLAEYSDDLEASIIVSDFIGQLCYVLPTDNKTD